MEFVKSFMYTGHQQVAFYSEPYRRCQTLFKLRCHPIFFFVSMKNGILLLCNKEMPWNFWITEKPCINLLPKQAEMSQAHLFWSICFHANLEPYTNHNECILNNLQLGLVSVSTSQCDNDLMISTIMTWWECKKL